MRCFGDYTNVEVAVEQCQLYFEKSEKEHQSKIGLYRIAINEVGQYVRNIEEKFGSCIVNHGPTSFRKPIVPDVLISQMIRSDTPSPEYSPHLPQQSSTNPLPVKKEPACKKVKKQSKNAFVETHEASEGEDEALEGEDETLGTEESDESGEEEEIQAFNETYVRLATQTTKDSLQSVLTQFVSTTILASKHLDKANKEILRQEEIIKQQKKQIDDLKRQLSEKIE